LNVQTGSLWFGNQSTLNFLTGSSGIIITGSSASGIANLVFNTGSSVATLLSGIVPTNELGTGGANASVFLRGDSTWSTPPSGVTNVRYASSFATSGAGTSGSPYLGWDNAVNGVFAAFPALPQPVTVIFEPGWFQAASGSELINRSFVSIMGYGPESVIKFIGYGTGLTWGGTTGSTFTSLAVNGLHLIGANLADNVIGSQIGILFSGCYDFWSSGNYGEQFGLSGSPTASEYQGVGIYALSGSKRGHIIGNRCDFNKLAGISIAGNNVTLNDLDYSEDIEVTSNICENNHRIGIHLLNDVRNVTITGNVCRGNEKAGISLENLSGKTANFSH